MRDVNEKAKLRDYEFTDYKFGSKASKRVRARIRRHIKRNLRHLWKRELAREARAASSAES